MNTTSASSPTATRDPYDHRAHVPSRRIPAWLFSLGLHTILFIAIILMLGNFRGGGSEVENRTGGIVLVNATTDTTEYLSEGDNTDSSSDAASQQSPPPLPTSNELPPNLPGVATSPAQVAGIGDDLMEAFPGVDSLLDGDESANLGGRVTTEVFGVKGTGSKFLYVFDRSDSMEGYEQRPLRAAKRALRASLESLGAAHQFQIIFYNNMIRVFEIGGEPPKMFFATDDNKEDAVNFIESINGDGGTDHLSAIKYALSLGPDVIFMLTDAEGGFTPAQLGAVSEWNRGTIINAIEFGIGKKRTNSDDSLERLAVESGGQYVYKNILTLRLDR